MSVLSDKWIRKMSKEEEMISPFEEKQIRGNNISYGLSSFGYDARVSDEFKIFTVAIDYANVKGCRITPNVFTTTNELDSFIKAMKSLASS